MKPIEITANSERTKRLYKQYFRFERKRELQKFPFTVALAPCLLFICIGLLASIDFLLVLGYISFGIVSLFILFHLAKFEIYYYRLMKFVEERSSHNFIFSFNEDEIIYESEEGATQLKWTAIKGYTKNNTEIYIYRDQKQLIDIISKQIIKEETFNLFKDILHKKSIPEEV